MSSSNLVRLAYIKESTYGQTPGSGNFSTMRFTSESLSGTPQTTESGELRSDRQSGGQIQTGLEVGGNIEFELSGAGCYKDFLASAMKNAWQADVSTAARSFTVDAAAGTLTSATGTGLDTLFSVSDVIVLSTGFVGNRNKVALVTAVTATVLTVVAKGLVNETAANGVVTRPERLDIGTTETSFTVEKNFLDLTSKTIAYTGAVVNSMSLKLDYGSIVTGSFTLSANGYSAPVSPITQGRTIDAATTENPLNASSDVGLVALDQTLTAFSIQSLGVELNNSLQPEVNVGSIAPSKYVLGSAKATLTATAYLANSNWDYMAKKIASTPVDVLYSAYNANGGIAVHAPAVQLSFSDPSSSGRDQIVSIEMSGTAKVDANGKSLRLYWLPAQV